jgi:hypothetical protein
MAAASIQSSSNTTAADINVASEDSPPAPPNTKSQTPATQTVEPSALRLLPAVQLALLYAVRWPHLDGRPARPDRVVAQEVGHRSVQQATQVTSVSPPPSEIQRPTRPLPSLAYQSVVRIEWTLLGSVWLEMSA